jgi:tripartite-type tricarboxylate transporter receptor subunit TctC
MSQGQRPRSSGGQRPTSAGLLSYLQSCLQSCAVLTVALALGTAPAAAQDPFTGKTVTIYVGFGPGGGYDLYARVLARHLGGHLPGRPTVVVANMPGAASIRAANYISNVAPKDGTALGMVAQSIAEEQLLGVAGISYDVTQLTFIGRIATNIEVTYVWHAAAARKLDDLRSTETTLAGTGPSSSIYPRLMNTIAGMKWKVIAGYNTTSAAHLAMQRREVDGATSSLNTLKTTQHDWLDSGLIRILVQLAPRRSTELAQVPAVVELAKTPEDRDVLAFYANSGTVGRSVIAPPGLPAERVVMLRSAFDATMRDREFRAEIEATKLELDPMAGVELQALVGASTRVSHAVLTRARAARAE